MNRWVYLISGCIAVIILAIGVVSYHNAPSQTKQRVLGKQGISFTHINWQTNGLYQPRLVEVVQGHISGAIAGIVKTDTDCMADSTGLSHCHNLILLANHQLIMVVYTHNMNRVKCLDPNQPVTVKSLNAHWAQIGTSSV